MTLVVAACTTRSIPRGDAQVPTDAGAPLTDTGTTAPDATPLPDAGPSLEDVLIYAHSPTKLFTFSPYSNTVTEIGFFTQPNGAAAPQMLDLAVDSEGAVFTSSRDSLWSVDPLTGTTTEVGSLGVDGAQLNALSFLTPSESPDGTEMLIGATNDGSYYRIDRNNARTTLLGQYPDGWFSSGDIVSIAGLGTFATLRSDDFSSDVLARILFSGSGASTVMVIGPIREGGRDFTQIFGLGYWGRNVYGFSNAGELIQIDRATGAGTVVTTSTGVERFWGAGVTTQAPILI